MENLKEYTVLYRIESVMSPFDTPFGFHCWAENWDHAEEQCLNAYPDCCVVWVFEGNCMDDAVADYYRLDVD